MEVKKKTCVLQTGAEQFGQVYEKSAYAGSSIPSPRPDRNLSHARLDARQTLMCKNIFALEKIGADNQNNLQRRDVIHHLRIGHVLPLFALGVPVSLSLPLPPSILLSLPLTHFLNVIRQ